MSRRPGPPCRRRRVAHHGSAPRPGRKTAHCLGPAGEPRPRLVRIVPASLRWNQRPLLDGQEIDLLTDPNNTDSDGDGGSDATDPNPTTFDDADGDLLSDYKEVNVDGTDPNNADSDGIWDGTEIDPATGTDPNNPDSDFDGVNDGDEVANGTNPNDGDTDGDGVGDATDPLPIDPGVTSGFLEDDLRELASNSMTGVCSFPLSEIEAKNSNAAKGRRNAICNKLNAAANAVADGDYQDAEDQLLGLLPKLDDAPSPNDWMVTGSPLKEALEAELVLMVSLIQLL